MSKIVNNNKLNLILTNYGLERVAAAVAEPSLNLSITKIKLGSGDNFEYYEPSPTQTELKGDLGIELYIYDKELLEDGLTVSFHTVIPEDLGGFEFREVGLYETHGGEDKLFAISTQQPFVKPEFDDNYFIGIDYYIFLKAQNFSEIYDQITLDVEHALVTEADLEELMRTFLFAQGSLTNQIGNNSTIIGYNRATQLYERMLENKKSFSYISLYKNFASLIDIVSSPDKIFSYWAFDYSRRSYVVDSIVDLSHNKYYLQTNKPVSSYKKTYKGFMSTFEFDTPDYYSLDSQIPLNLYNAQTNEDSPFTIMYAIDPVSTAETRTIMAKSNYANHNHTIEVQETFKGEILVRLFSSPDDYLTFTTSEGIVPEESHSVVITYDPQLKRMRAFVNSNEFDFSVEETGNYTHITEAPSSLYAYSCIPSFEIYADSSSTPTTLYNIDGTLNENENWRVEDDKVYFKEYEAQYVTGSDTVHIGTLHAWVPQASSDLDHIIYTYAEPVSGTNLFSEEPVLYTADHKVYDGDEFMVFGVGEDKFGIFYVFGSSEQTEHYAPADIPAYDIYKYECTLPMQTIWANSFTVPSILYTVTTYEEEGQIKTIVENYSGTDWVILEIDERPEILYLGQEATRNSSEDAEVLRPPLTSYIIDSDGQPQEFINSSVGLISIIKEKLPKEYARIFALNLCGTMGRNPYLT